MCLFLLWISLAGAAAVRKSDSEIEQDLRARFSRSKLASDGIQFRVKNGVATLSGNTNVLQHKGNATRMAKSSGAIQVVNDIRISDEARRAASERLARGRAKSHAEKRTERPKESRPQPKPVPERPSPTAAAPVRTLPPAAPAAPSATLAPPPVRRAQIRH